ncbi:Proline iminopeptidase, partial [Metamycoplasma alkalescens]
MFDPIEPYKKGYLKVSDIHQIYYEEVGNPKGSPILFVHGGPGGGISESSRQYFDPKHYRIILFDQRGCGKSLPSAEIKQNTTLDLVNDIEALRIHLNIEKW